MGNLTAERASQILSEAARSRLLVVGDVMLDQFIWGRVSRISPEAPVPVVDFERESLMPGGAANVARNVSALGGKTDLFGAVGHDPHATSLRELLGREGVGCAGLVPVRQRQTTTKIRIVAGQQQITRLDRETRGDLEGPAIAALLRRIETRLDSADGVVIGDYGKGVVTQPLIDGLKARCRARGKWLSLDPKPVHRLDLRGVSLLTPNRKEAFELSGFGDTTRHQNPMKDAQLQRTAEKLLGDLQPALLLITLGELGMLLCRKGEAPFHIPTVAREVFDVSGAGDTVIAAFTLAIAAGASPEEAAEFSNCAAGVVVGKRGTATVSPEELLATIVDAA
jgi:D-glycero-beta-D-manno-heptose-7-phosphate kinase